MHQNYCGTFIEYLILFTSLTMFLEQKADGSGYIRVKNVTRFQEATNLIFTNDYMQLPVAIESPSSLQPRSHHLARKPLILFCLALAGVRSAS